MTERPWTADDLEESLERGGGSDDAGPSHEGSDQDGPDDDDGYGQDRSDQDGSSLREVIRRVRRDLADITGLDVDRVSGLAPADDGWRAQVDVVELSRLPPSTDVLATFEVTTDGDGNVLGFERTQRFRRSESQEDEG